MSFKGDLEALILGVLDGTEMHGYEIAKRIRQLSETALSYGEGQLYPALHSLEQDGLIVASWIPQEGKPARKVYRLTDEGTGALAKKRSDWEAFAKGVGAILDPRKPVLECRRSQGASDLSIGNNIVTSIGQALYRRRRLRRA